MYVGVPFLLPVIGVSQKGSSCACNRVTRNQSRKERPYPCVWVLLEIDGSLRASVSKW